jgi:hypothetical protein
MSDVSAYSFLGAAWLGRQRVAECNIANHLLAENEAARTRRW